MSCFGIFVDLRCKVATVVLAFAFTGLLAPHARAQQVAVAQLDGYVTDQSGQAIAGAQVKATEVDRQQVHLAATDITGRYQFPDLAAGNYQLEVSYKGFKTYVQKGIGLDAGNNRTQPVVLQVGSTTESVEVTANATQVETKENAISQLVDSERMVDLPLNGRNPTQLLAISGFATNTMTLNGGDLTGSKNIQGSNGSTSYSVAGGAANGVNYLLDGGDNNDAFSNVNLPLPFPDAISEFNILTSSLPAQYGLHPGGVVNIVTKSGGNAFHGDFFDFLRNGDLNARPKGFSASQPIRDSLKRNQFGGTVGGPVKKDRLFFFGGYQGTRQRSNPASSTAYDPTAATLAGDFSVVDGAKSNGGCLSSARVLKNPQGNPYPNNQIPVSTFDPAGLKLASTYFPVSTNPCGNYLYGDPANNPDDQWIGRVDYNINDKNILYGRYYIYDYYAEVIFANNDALTTQAAPANWDRSQTMTIGETYTLSSTAVNSFHFTFDRRRDNRASPSTLFSPGTLGVNMFINQSDYTQLAVSSYSGGGFGVGCGTCALADFDINTYQLADDFTLIRGKHQIGIGFDGRKDQFNSYNYQQANGQFTFNGTYTGDGLADLLTGQFSGLTDGNVISDYLRQTPIAAYVQDSFHATQHFSINYGLRWEPSVPSYDKYGRGNQFSWPLFLQNWHSSEYPTAPAGLIFSGDTAQDPNGKAFTRAHYATFSPRLGMVWDPKGNGKQTLRAGFVLMHDTTELFYPERWTTNAPYVSSLTINSNEFGVGTDLFSNPFNGYVLNGKPGDPFPGAAVFPLAGTYVSVPPNLPVTYMMQWNLSYQRQIAANWVVQANYLGNAGRDIWGSTDVNYSIPVAGATASNANSRRLTYLINPTLGQYYADIQQTDSGAVSEYHALNLSAQHAWTRHYTARFNYTWSHCSSSWDFAGELAGVVYQNPLNRAEGERGNCGFDHRQAFFATLVASSAGIGTGFVHGVTKDWQLSPIVSFNTGNPIQLSVGGKDISLSAQLLDRPEVIAPDQVYQRLPPTVNGTYWFNPNAFICADSVSNVSASTLSPNCPAATASTAAFGDLGRNSVYGPGAIQWDMNVSRRFNFKERWKLEFRAEFFNILNHANWSNPSSSLTSSTFGEVTGYGGPRIIQMALKLYF
ncbi:MAG: carboxypeptidase regulatory-like domain-containing protein [Bryobacteraceae bacterium]